MRKIPTLFARDLRLGRPRTVLPDVTPGCEWVTAGEGRPTRKWDGTCTMLDEHGNWWARREVKPGKDIPRCFVTVQHDEATGKLFGWEPMAQSSFAKIHAEAVTNSTTAAPGTYELLGPKINRNPDGFDAHILLPHGWAPLSERIDVEAAPRDFDGLREWLHTRPYEGIVWHHPDGRMTKIKKRDFATPEQQQTAVSPADELRTAASKLRARLADPELTPGPWRSMDRGDRLLHDGPGAEDQAPVYVVDEPMSNGANADYIATMHPGVGHALAQLLEETADHTEHGSGAPGHPVIDPTIALARIVLGGEQR